MTSTQHHINRKPIKAALKSAELALLLANEGIIPTAQIGHIIEVLSGELERVRQADAEIRNQTVGLSK